MKFFFLVHWPGWRHQMPDTHLKTTNTGVPMESSMALQQRALEWSQTATHRQQMVMFSRWSCSLVLPWGPGVYLCHDHESHHHYWCNVEKFTSIISVNPDIPPVPYSGRITGFVSLFLADCNSGILLTWTSASFIQRRGGWLFFSPLFFGGGHHLHEKKKRKAFCFRAFSVTQISGHIIMG